MNDGACTNENLPWKPVDKPYAIVEIGYKIIDAQD